MAKTKKNPTELLIFGNPKNRKSRRASTESKNQKTKNGRGFGNHRAGCPCAFCKRAAKLQSGELKPPPLPHQRKNSPRLQKQKAARDRAAQIRAARINPRKKNLYRGTVAERLQVRASRKLKKGGLTRAERQRLTGVARGHQHMKDRLRASRNPSETEQAVSLYGIFHGKDAQEILEKHRSAAIRSDYTALGDLEYLQVQTPLGQKVTFQFEGDHVKLASSPDGKQLYCIGGNQNIAPCLDKDSLAKDIIDVGDCVEVAYTARKIHSNYEAVEWYHKFGEDSGALPRIVFDKLKKELFFAGGEYFIDVNVAISPGIEN
jgi:hypothetical protein